MLTYADIDPKKSAFIFELDNVLYPEKDYLLQIYYLFANFLEYVEAVPLAADLTAFLKKAYEHHGSDGLFERARSAFGIDPKYRENFFRLHVTAKLPLPLVLYPEMLSLLQEIVVDRKQLYIITNGNPAQQLNKIRQTDWNGLEKYLRVYFAEEIKPKPETDVLEYVLTAHQLLRKDILLIGNSAIDEEFAEAAGVDYVDVADFR
ncbi:HAD family hydrolase [Pedobacter sp. BS3]|uniref:HAD family hydrolase n=1 Tax=Pedobacter sp. BS3 TaxID=2567937 RepID=UPI0011ECEE43|nr:HAD family hydrolase [Pedobacter sp. BS3]TZF84747.1 HAD family hydrolase [Pedobacter sp. BS3]